MSWFDTAGFTSLAKSALKEAQRTIDKALDIDENNENAEPAPAHKGISEKLRDESENFFASFGLEKKKSPLTPANTPVEPTPLPKDTEEDEDGDKSSTSSAAMVGSLWGSFTGSFFDNTSANKKETQDTPETPSSSQKKIVATQPPRSSTSLPSLQLPKSPVSTQPRTASLEEYQIDSTGSQETAGKEAIGVQPSKNSPDVGDASATQEWGWGWDSSIMVMSSDQQQLEGELNASQGEIDGREDSLVDDDDEDGFSRSRLVVGSVDSDGFSRQESQGSLCGRSIDLDVPSVISEDVFDSGQAEQAEKERENGATAKSDVSSDDRSANESRFSERRTAVSSGNSEVNTPESIVLLTSDSSPDGEVANIEASAASNASLTINLSAVGTSPISSPDSIEVLGSCSVVTSPSSIEVLSGISSSDSSPTHQDSCSITLTEDRSPPTISLQPITRPPSKRDHEPPQCDQLVVFQESIVSEKTLLSKDSEIKPSDEVSASQKAVVKQPTFWDKEESMYPKDGDSCSHSGSSLLEDLSASESIHSTSTSSTHTVLDTSAIIQASDPHLVSTSPEPQSFDSLVRQVTEPTPKPAEDNEVSENRTEVDIAALPLDISVESGGSSDTITASLDSSQMALSCKSHTGISESDQELKESEENTMSTSGGSVVRCLLEEAIGDEEAVSNNSSPPEREHSPSSSERSEALKVGSGHTSGHSSGDEIETTTSSDIEVISSPSLDGSTVARGSAAASRVWASAQRGLRSFLNDRSESPASDSSSNNKKNNADKAETVPSSMTTSFTSISESEGESSSSNVLVLSHLTLDPSSISQVLQDLPYVEKGHRRNQSNFSETSESSSEPHSPEMEKLLKKVSHLTEVLEARETKLMELSQVNAALQDTNLRMKTRIEELEGGGGNDATESLREEFTQRLVTMERKFQQALREKEATKKQLEEVRAEAATRLSSTEVAREREERDIVIKELREEGEKLSKQQLSYSNIVKKLRSKEKENETTIKTQKDKLEEQSRELDRLRKQLSAKEEMERRQIDAVCQLNVNNQRLEQMIKDTNAENAELEGKMSALKNALDTAYKEMTELQRVAATKDAEAQEQALSAEVELRKQLESTLAEAQAQACREQEALMAQVVELQDSLSRAETQANRKERQLRADISELQQRVSEAEARAEELSGAVSAATRPLLRQMENLQSTHSTQQATWESLESTLTRRLTEAQSAAAANSEKERAMREQYAEVSATAAALQTQVANLRAENTKLSSQVDLLTSKVENLTEVRHKENTQIEALKASFAEEIGEIKRERDSLEQQLEIEKTALAAEKKKSHSLQEQVKEREKRLLQCASGAVESHASTPRSSPTPSLSRISVSGSLNESFTGSQWGDEVFESSWSRGTSLYDSVRGNATATVDALTSQLRQREGEVHHLQSEITRYEAQRESLAQELVSVTTQLDALQNQLQDFQALQQQYKDMEQKYNALLQMHGEKVEEVEELRLDLADVKEMYKAQIDQLLQK
ncbi:TATA element modulatory factor-like isoform X1 [Macrobrachium rosenbergii]|uniref:TATA element modulatory factor-like isoform X1 n=1 Tax=Macrobrachium rosenbergii TaxID=79674 RepID=UPI0034D6B44F